MAAMERLAQTLAAAQVQMASLQFQLSAAPGGSSPSLPGVLGSSSSLSGPLQGVGGGISQAVVVAGYGAPKSAPAMAAPQGPAPSSAGPCGSAPAQRQAAMAAASGNGRPGVAGNGTTAANSVAAAMREASLAAERGFTDRSPSERPPVAEAEPVAETPEVPRCHLHRKQNKVCKYCKAHAAFLGARAKENEDRKMAVLERLRGDDTPKVAGGDDDKVPVPNAQHFPQVLKERIVASSYYTNVLANQDMGEVKDALQDCDSCEPEVRGLNLDTAPSSFICSVFRLLCSKLTEGQLRSLLGNRSIWVRCAAYVFIRLGTYPDRYWEFLSDALLDDEEFLPFPGRGPERLSEGQFVEQLLTKEKYCDMSLPRMPVATRKALHERLVLYDVFRKRYTANMQIVEERFSEAGVPVEVCSWDGEWVSALTTAPASQAKRRVTVPVRFPGASTTQAVSLGMVVALDKGCERVSSSLPHQDLTRSRGRDYQDLLEKFRLLQRDAAVATGKDYCKNSARRTVHAGGMTFVAGDHKDKRKRGTESDSEEDSRAKVSRQHCSAPSVEHQARMAAIVQKYCAHRCGSSGQDQQNDRNDVPDRLRLG